MSEFPPHFEMLNKKLDNVTSELISMRESVNVIQENTEISIKNGGGIEVKMKTNELLKHVYENIKPDGIIDKKFIQCRQDHATINILGKFNKNAGVVATTFKFVIYAIISFAVLYGAYKGNQRDKVENDLLNKVDNLEKLIK